MENISSKIYGVIGLISGLLSRSAVRHSSALFFSRLPGKKIIYYAYPKDGFRQSAHDNPQWQERAKKAVALAYLKKPFHEHALLDAIRLACGKRV